MNASKNIFSALSVPTTPKTTQTVAKKKGKKKSTPISLVDPPVHVPVQAAPRHPLRTEMTEDEELQAALEASKRELDKPKAKQIQQGPQQWSSLVKSASSTTGTVSNNGAQVVIPATKPKNAAVGPTATNMVKAVAAPPRSTANPWASNPVVPPKFSEPSPPPPSTTSSASPISTTSSLTMHTVDSYDDEQVSDEEPMIPLSIRPVAIHAPAINPISLPNHSNDSHLSNHSAHVINSILDEDESDFSIPNSQLALHDQVRPSQLIHPHQQLGLLSSRDESIMQSLTHMQDTLQKALSRISQLEQSNDILMTRMTRIVEASVHLEQSVASTTAENALLKSQIAELRTNYLLSQNTLSTPSGPASNNLFSSQNGFHTYFQPQGFSTGPRAPNQQTIGMGLSNGLSNGLYSTPMAHTPSLSTNDDGHGFSSPGFASNGYHG